MPVGFSDNFKKSVAYSSQGSHTGLLDFCNWSDKFTIAKVI